jgi:two-component system response regulator YesN
MLKVVIVEDEPIVREGLQSCDWASLGCEISGTAEDGQEGLLQLERLKPDIMITDIKMPCLDGIELSRRAKEKFPGLHIIILTGYADFSYAQNALQIGVSDFLLKPIDFRSLAKTITKMASSIRNTKEQQDRYHHLREKLAGMMATLKKQVIYDLLYGNIATDSQQITVCGFPPQKYIVMVFQTDGQIDDLNSLGMYGFIREKLESSHYEYYLTHSINDCCCMLPFERSLAEDDCEAAALGLGRSLQTAIENSFGFTISVGISPVDTALQMLNQLRTQAIKALNHRFILGSGLLLLYSDIQEMYVSPVNLQSLKKSLCNSLLARDEAGLVHYLERISKQLTGIYSCNIELIKLAMFHIFYEAISLISEAATMDKMDYNSLRQLMRCEDLALFLTGIQEMLCQLMKLSQRDTNNLYDSTALNILQYIEDHYGDDLSLDLLSRQLNYSTSYLSRLIKKTYGKTFMDILVEIRIKNARKMLADSCRKIQQISKMVGYNDLSYFIQVFKKHTGYTPNEYRLAHCDRTPKVKRTEGR